jgi:hypothetical protein
MKKSKLPDWEIENIEYLIPEMEEMFHIKLSPEESRSISDFEELCTVISNKISQPHIDSCTKQQTFYKLRKVLDKLGILKQELLTLKTPVEEFLPRKTRREELKKIEGELGFKTNLIKPPTVLTKVLTYGLLLSLIGLSIRLNIALIAVIIFTTTLVVTIKNANELRVTSTREMVELLARENYLNVRSQNGTVNRNELKRLIIDWFSDRLELEKRKLLNSKFV